MTRILRVAPAATGPAAVRGTSDRLVVTGRWELLVGVRLSDFDQNTIPVALQVT